MGRHGSASDSESQFHDPWRNISADATQRIPVVSDDAAAHRTYSNISQQRSDTTGTSPRTSPRSSGTRSRTADKANTRVAAAGTATKGPGQARSAGKRSTGKRASGKRAAGNRTPLSYLLGVLKWLGLLILAAAVLGVIIFIFMYLFVRLPSPGDIPTAQRVTLVASDNKTVLGTIIPAEGNRREVSSGDIPPAMKYAAMSAEDRDFQTNKGFSVTGFGRAALGQITGRTEAGGGSTITQQYVKNALVGNEHSYWRKFKELVIAMKMSNQWNKDEILTAYLNTIYLGRGVYGVQTASQAYFNKDVQKISVSEAALLAAIIQQPSNLDPADNPEAARERWQYVINGMVQKRWLSTEEAKTLTFPKTVKVKNRTLDNKLAGPNGLLKAQILNELGKNGIDEKTVTSEGLRIVTTISPKAQDAVLDAVSTTLKGQPKVMRAAAVSVNPKTGAVLAYYGGSLGTGFDYAMAPEMTGSTFKVFTLAAALDQGIPPWQMYSSAPYKVGNLTITNAGGQTCGTCSVSQATVMSLNTSYYRIMMDLENGPNDVRDMAIKAGIPSQLPGYGKMLQDKDGSVRGGITLGMYPTRPFDMAVAFATFANRGTYHEPFFVQKAITNGGRGRLIYEHTEKGGERRIRKLVADNVNNTLRPVAAYSNNHGLAGGRVSASKTGTVQLGETGSNRDAWMVGYTPQISTAVWVGTQNGTVLRTKAGADVWGSTLPSDIWQKTMNGALEDEEFEDFHAPGSVGGQGTYEYTVPKTTTKKSSTVEDPYHFDDITITRPTLPGLPGIENPWAPPTTVMPTQPSRRNDDVDDDDAVMWR